MKTKDYLQLTSLQGWHLNYNKKNFSIIPYGVDQHLTPNLSTMLKTTLGYIYVTDDVLPNPWNSLPSYFSNLATHLTNDFAFFWC